MSMSQVNDKIITKKAFEVDLSVAEEMSAEDIDKELKKKKVNMCDVGDVFNQITGEVLTVVDACITDKEQKKAMKDLIKHSIYDGLDTLHALTDDQKCNCSETPGVACSYCA